MSEVFAGIDLGGTGTRLVIWGAGGVLAARTLATADLGAGEPEVRLTRLAHSVRDLLPARAVLAGVGIGASGPVDRAAGMVRNLDTLPAFSDIPLVADLRRQLRVPVAIDNDAVTAAIAEQRVGAGQASGRMLMVTLGTGIGAALLIGGEPFRGPDGAHPEAGHIPVASGVGRCYCGAEGCWEQAASRTALQAMLRPLLPADVADRDLLAHAANLGDAPLLRRAFRDYGRLVGQGLSVLHSLYRPEVTLLGGTAAACLGLFADGLADTLARASGFAVAAEIRAAALGDEAGAIGAALMAREEAGSSAAGMI